MSILKNETSQRLLKRTKRLSLLIVLLPLLTAVFAYVLESKTPTVFTAEAEVVLGNFQDEKLTNLGALPKFMTSENFFEDEDVKEIAKQLSFEKDPGPSALTFSLSGNTEVEVETKLTTFLDAFMENSDQRYEDTYNFLKEKKKKVENLEVNAENAVSKEELLVDLEDDLDGLRNTYISKEVTVSSSYNNPLNRAVFGFIIGLMLSVIIVVAPEVFRK